MKKLVVTPQNKHLYLVIPEDVVELHWEVSKNLPKLPAGLKRLYANLVTRLREDLPEGLEVIECRFVKKLPIKMPPKLRELNAPIADKVPGATKLFLEKLIVGIRTIVPECVSVAEDQLIRM